MPKMNARTSARVRSICPARRTGGFDNREDQGGLGIQENSQLPPRISTKITTAKARAVRISAPRCSKLFIATIGSIEPSRIKVFSNSHCIDAPQQFGDAPQSSIEKIANIALRRSIVVEDITRVIQKQCCLCVAVGRSN